MKIIFTIIITFLMFSSTQINAKEKPAKSSNKKVAKLHCVTRKKTGTHFRTKVCTTKEQRQKDLEDAKRITDHEIRVKTKALTPVPG
ncbi:MAG: hypothetical protein L3J83_12515 [Proteobacteria bacterium]|nr:hypothetical protein [Pseudomonadota bacterium]